MVGAGDGVLGAAEALGEGGELGPFSALEGEEDFVEVAIAVFAAAESGFDFGIHGKRVEDILHRFVEERIADGEEAHEKKVGTFFAKTGGRGKLLAEIGPGEGSADEFERLAAAHGDDGEDGNPAAKFVFAEQGDSVADTVNFGAQAERGGIEIAEEAVEQGRLLLQEIFDGVVVEVGSGDGAEELKLDELVAGDVAGFEHGRFAEKVALEIGVAEVAGFVEVTLRFDFFSKKGDAVAGELFSDALAAFGVEEGEIHLEVVGEFDERAEIGVTKEIVEGQEVAVLTEFAAEVDDFAGRLHGFEDFKNHAVGGHEPRRAEAKRHFIHIDESAGGAGEGLQIKQRQGIGDDARRGVAARLEKVLRAAAEQQFVGVDPQPFIKDRLAGDEFLVHADIKARRSGPIICFPRRHSLEKRAGGVPWGVRPFPQGLKPLAARQG